MSAQSKTSMKNYDERDLISAPMFNVTDLKKGFKYQFRVTAVNTAGKSPVSYSTIPIECRQQFEAPIINLDYGQG